MQRRPIATIASAALLVGLGFAAGKIPANSVGSTQIKNNSVASIDLKDNSVASVDLKDNSVASADIQDNSVASADIQDKTIAAKDIADGVVPGASLVAFTANSMGGCGNAGWCYLPTTFASQRVIAQFHTSPPNSSGWQSTGQITVTKPTRIVATASINMWFFGGSNIDVMCAIKDGTTALWASGWVRHDGNTSQTITFSASTVLTPGEHLLLTSCYAGLPDSAAATSASLTVVGVPSA